MLALGCAATVQRPHVPTPVVALLQFTKRTPPVSSAVQYKAVRPPLRVTYGKAASVPPADGGLGGGKGGGDRARSRLRWPSLPAGAAAGACGGPPCPGAGGCDGGCWCS